MINNVVNKKIEQSRMPLLEQTVNALHNLQRGEFGPLLLTFWGSRGMGKTILLENIYQYLNDNYPTIAIKMLNIDGLSTEKIEQGLPNKFKKIRRRNGAAILLDNVDELLRRSIDGQEFFEFEHDIILPIIERGNTLIITSSQIELNQWREDDVRVRLINIKIPALKEKEIIAMANNVGMDAKKVYRLTFGQPKVVSWLLKHQAMDEKEIAEKAFTYFLEDIPDGARGIADIICLLPLFNAYLLKKIINNDPSKSEVQYMQCLEWLKEYIRLGLVSWDVSMGSYRFTDSAVQHLLARHVFYETPDVFRQIQQIASDYFQAEARSPGYLHIYLTSAVYHLSQTLMMQEQTQENIGKVCLEWVKKNLNTWLSARWDEVLSNWQKGCGDDITRDEIIQVIGSTYFGAITHEIEKVKRKMEVTK